MDILIAVPTFENIYPDTFKSIYGLNTGEYTVTFDFIRGYDCATARNHIADRSIFVKADYVLMVDNDVVLPRDALLNLMEDTKDVCLGYYAHRDADNAYHGNTCVCRLYKPDGTKYFNYPIESQYTGKELSEMKNRGEYKVQIHGGGMGCALIKTDVFKHLEYPWYGFVNLPNRGHTVLSEDLTFCEKCKQADIPIYTDTRVGCGHMMRHVQWP